MSGFLDVLLRGLALCGQSVAVGGVIFAFLVLRRGTEAGRAPAPLRRTLSLIALGAITVALAQTLAVAAWLWGLGDHDGWPLREALGTTYARASLVRIAAAMALAVGAGALQRPGARAGWWPTLLIASVALGASSAWISHAAARLQHRSILLMLDALHQLAVAAWVGGLVHLTATAFRQDRPWAVPLLQRFSRLSVAAVAVLVASGAGLASYYVDSVRALVGTAYGLMVLTKIVILGGLVGLGALNFLAVRRLPTDLELSPLRLRRFVEVEMGLGITVLFVAASLTSLPPAVDVVADRATPAEVALRFTPRWPALTSPRITDMPVLDPHAPRTDADRAWSEFNHHVAGLFVLGMGLLATLHTTGRARWARNWPLVFLALAGFLMIRNDPGDWPLGPRGFWEGFLSASVLQHRVFVLLVVLFGVLEWAVRSDRLRSRRAALIFPLLCAVGGGLLLTHSHASLNLKGEFLIEVTHAPLGVLAMAVGWGRWLELRLPGNEARLPGRIWALCFTLIGALLLIYRES